MQKPLPLTFLEKMFVWFAVLSDPHPEGLPSTCAWPCMQSSFYFTRCFSRSELSITEISISLLAPPPRLFLTRRLRSLTNHSSESRSWNPEGQARTSGRMYQKTSATSSCIPAPMTSSAVTCFLSRLTHRFTQPGFLRPTGNAIKQSPAFHPVNVLQTFMEGWRSI